MKRNHLLTLLVGSAIFIASCSDEESISKQKTEGRVKANFVGCINKVTTRVVGEKWDLNDIIGISGDKYTNIPYKTSTEGVDRSFSPVNNDTIYIEGGNPITYKAYSPYSESGETFISKTITGDDQKNNSRCGLNFMYGTGVGTLNSPFIELKMEHKMSQITLNFKSELVDLSEAKSFTLKNLSLSGSFNTDNGYINVDSKKSDLIVELENCSGYSHTTFVIIYPQEAREIPLEMTLASGIVKGVIPINDAAITKSRNYICNVTVSKEGLDINSVTSEWDDLEQESESTSTTGFLATIQSLTTVSGINDLTLKVGSEVKPLDSKKLNIKANDQIEISFKIDENKKVTEFNPIVKKGKCKVLFTKDNITGISSVIIKDLKSDIQIGELSLVVSEQETSSSTTPQIGDFYYSDGTWSSDFSITKSCIGIVFSNAVQNPNTYFMALNGIKGHVIALKNAMSNREAFNCDVNDLSAGYAYEEGYVTCNKYKNYNDFNTQTTSAIFRAVNYTPQAPAATSGWYLPSLGEFKTLFENFDKIRPKIVDAGGDDMRISYGFYWCCSTKNDEGILPMLVDVGAWVNNHKYDDKIFYQDLAYIRSILTF